MTSGRFIMERWEKNVEHILKVQNRKENYKDFLAKCKYDSDSDSGTSIDWDAVGKELGINPYFINVYEGPLEGLNKFPMYVPLEYHIGDDEVLYRKLEYLQNKKFEDNYFKIASGKDILNMIETTLKYKKIKKGYTDKYKRNFDVTQTIIESESIIEATRIILSGNFILYGGEWGDLSSERTFIITCYNKFAASIFRLYDLVIEEVQSGIKYHVPLNDFSYDECSLLDTLNFREYSASFIVFNLDNNKLSFGTVDSNPFKGFAELLDLNNMTGDEILKKYTNYKEVEIESELEDLKIGNEDKYKKVIFDKLDSNKFDRTKLQKCLLNLDVVASEVLYKVMKCMEEKEQEYVSYFA